MLNIQPGAMRGNIGRWIWFNGCDVNPDADQNVLDTNGYTRFGLVQWLDLDVQEHMFRFFRKHGL